MKKIITGMALAMCMYFSTSTQASAQAVEEGNMLIDVYYGFPNLYTSVFKAAYANSGTEIDLSVGGIGPVGGRFEYMLADRIGLGLDIGFNNSSITYKENGTNSNGNAVQYEYDFTTTKLGFMVTMNYHFDLSNEDLDVYAMFGIGYGNRKFVFDSTDPTYSESSIESLIPVASRLGVGMRYFFTEQIGANLALGIGHGGLVNAGLSARI
jgi:outer membrane protein W